MKKIVQTVLILTLASVVVISCKKKSDDPAPSNNNNSSIEGTWNIDSSLFAYFIDGSLEYSDTAHYAPGEFEISFNGGQSISKHTDTSGTDYDTVAYFITNANELNVIFEMDSATKDTVQYIFTITNSNKLHFGHEQTSVDMGETIKQTIDFYGTRK